MILASDVEEKIRSEIDKFRKEKPGVCYDMKRIAVSEDGKWALVEYNGTWVYASMKYLTNP